MRRWLLLVTVLSTPLLTHPAAATAPPAQPPATSTGGTAPGASGGAIVRGGTEQIEIIGAAPATAVSFHGPDGTSGTGTTDAQGAFLFRNLAPGGPYGIGVGDQEFTVTVLGENDHPPQSLYDGQRLGEGFGYITTRDGTTLSANVVLPGPIDQGPYPTVIEYNGYSPSDPGGAAFARLYTSQGFAYVGVNMRGTGCSGGSYGLFDTNNALDGYDVVETVAAQPWVAHHGVGLVGISYGGISQLFVAARRPPSLKAITPLSVYDDAFRSLSYPGGLLNTGFTEQWLKDRSDQSKPYGQGWTKTRADAGDFVCAFNQLARLQQYDIVALNRSEPFFPGPQGSAAKLVPAEFVKDITVPIFLAGAWQDEQTGARFATMLNRFAPGAKLFVDLTNGGHTDSLNPTTMARYAEFLNLYVADRVPDLGALKLIGAALDPVLYGTTDLPEYTNRFAGKTLDQARAAFESEPRVRVLVESGGKPGATPGAPLPNTVISFPSWPPPTAVTTRWLLDAGGKLVTDGSSTSGSSNYVADPTALPATYYSGDGNGVWRHDVHFDWKPIPAGDGAGYATDPLPTDTVVAGSGSVDLWISSTATDTDLEATISEIRPDGTEIYVQSGWLRASQRALDPAASTELRPVQTHRQADAAPLPAGTLTPVRVELYPVVHPFRAGSRIRLTIDAPGDARAVWAFDTLSRGETVTIAHDAAHPSALVLAVVPGVALPPAPPACGSLRLQPCRPYQPAGNGG